MGSPSLIVTSYFLQGSWENFQSIVRSVPKPITPNDNQWEQLWKYEETFSPRTTGKQNLRIVKGFQTHENTAAMTRDEVNDLPVLKIADVGVALGSGSDIAIEAADTIRFDAFSAIAKHINMGGWS
ncbi:hypothetical protein I7I50_05499 [Histoplasma capsulatum G186AR]|nr:hypothetical protein I7I52_03760 [Histoplasma capsulatum]QSS76142.1 hypothetical protein I7I50_05499 [Histoplasma capsulatum G186AR]